MNENATIDWVENVLKNFTFGKRRRIMEQAYKRSTERNVWPVDG